MTPATDPLAAERERWALYFEVIADRHGNSIAGTTLRAAASDLRADLALPIARLNQGATA